MLSRPATKITLTLDDLKAYEEHRQSKESAKAEAQYLDSSQSTENSTGNGDVQMGGSDLSRQAREKRTRELRIMGDGRGRA